MPTRPLHACRQPGCAALVVSGRCALHGGADRPWGRPSLAAPLRKRGLAERLMRARVLAEEPTCYLCAGWARADDVVDHVQPLAAGGTDARDNLHRCCRRCHAGKTARESRAAQRD